MFILLPLVVLAVGVLAYFTFRTTLQIDTLRQQSVLEATLALATEKATRIDRQIIDQDNVVMAIADPAKLDELAERWLPTAPRETPSVRAIVIVDETRTVQAFASRATNAFADDEAFRRLLVDRLMNDMELGAQPPDELHHLHREYRGQSYLLSYWQRLFEGRRYVVVARHDIGRVVRETLPMLLDRKDTEQGQKLNAIRRVNVVDEEGRLIYGPPLGSGEFTVAVRFPTTLYNWRVQVSPLASEELAARVQNRRLLELATMSLSCIIIVVAAIAILLVAEKERRISALKSEFVANVSHELKTPLALVRMFAEMLQSGRVSTPAKQKEYLDIILRESERLSALIENVLDFARLERGRGNYEFAEGDVGDAVSRAANVYRYRAEREGVQLVVDVEPDLPRARFDERAIQLAVVNLVDNALKYAPNGKQILVRVSEGDGEVRVDVVDRGPGVAAEDRQRIFERFVRLPNGRRDEAGAGPTSDGGSRPGGMPSAPPRGSGIGLALVKHIAQSHGGRAWVESGAGTSRLSPHIFNSNSEDLPPFGSTFSFTVPAEIGGRRAAREPSDDAALPS